MLLSKYLIRFDKSLCLRIFYALIDFILFPLSLFNRKIENIEKILVIRKDEIGDMILSTPMYRAIKIAYPNSKLIVVSGKPSAQIIKKNPYVNEVIEINSIKNSKNFLKDYFRLINEIRKRKIDLAFDPKGSILNILLMYLSQVKRRVSYWNVSGGKYLLTDPIYYDRQMNETEAGINLIRKIGKNATNTIPRVFTDKKDVSEANKVVKKLPKDYVCVYMTPTSKYKTWPESNWKKLFENFKKANFVILCRDSEKETLIKFERKNVSLLSIDNLRALGIVISKARAVVAVDGGIMHLSWCSNPKTISLFGQNDITLWEPMQGSVISHYPKEKQGLNREVPELDKENRYMKMITVSEVSDKLKEFIKNK